MRQDKIFKILLAFCILFSLSMLASAQESDFTMNITPIKDDIYEDDAGVYELTITNNADFTEYFERPSTYQPDWITYTNPGAMMVPAGETRKFNLSLDPKSDVIPAQYEVKFSVRSSVTKEFIDDSVFIYVRPLNQAFPGYKASIALSVEIPYEIDPRKEVPVTVYLRNRNALNVDNLTILIESDLIDDQITFPFLPLEEKTTQLRYKLDPYHEPVEDLLSVKILIKNVTVNNREIPIKVVGYTDLDDNIVTRKLFLKKVTLIDVTNEGNIVNHEEYRVPVKRFANIFTGTDPDSTKVVNDEIYRSFSMDLEPRETVQLKVVTNYRIIFYVILIIFFSILSYYKFRSPIVLKKRIIPIHDPENQGVNEFHIRILLMNRTRNPVENIGITEVVPRIVSVIKEHDIGTLEPTKVINHAKKGTLLKWDINYLEPFEERIITFKIISKLGIVGSLVLAKTKAKYETKNGTQRITYSSRESLKV